MMCIPVPNMGNACHPAIVGAVVGEHRCSALALTAHRTPVVFRRSWLLSAVHNWAVLCAAMARATAHDDDDTHVHAAWHTQTYVLFHPADADLSLQFVRALAGRTPRCGGTHSQAPPHSSSAFNVKILFILAVAAAQLLPCVHPHCRSIAPALQRMRFSAKKQRHHCSSCVGVWGLGFRVWGLRFRVWGLGFGVWGLGFGG